MAAAGSSAAPTNDREDISHLDDDEKQYLASWYYQTKTRMDYPKVKAMIAAQRFKNLLIKKKGEPEPEPEEEEEEEPQPDPEPVVATKPATPPPTVAAPPVRAPPKKRRRRKEVAGVRDIDLVYIEPGGPLPEKWKKKPNTDPSEQLKLAQLEQWQRKFALRFLEKSWGDPYFARAVMLDMNTRMRLRNQDISRQKRQILEMQRDHMIMKDYITELENRNGRLKKNYFKGVPYELDALPVIPFEKATRQERRAIEDRLRMIDEIRFLREKQFVDKEVLKDYSRRLGGHVTRPDIEAVRQLVPSVGAAAYVPQLDEFHADLKEKYFMLRETIDRQDADLKALERSLKHAEVSSKTMNSLKEFQQRNDQHFEERIRRLRAEREDPVLDYYRNYRSLMEDPRLPYIREAMHTEQYQKSKLKNQIDQLDREISSFKRENVFNSKLKSIR